MDKRAGMVEMRHGHDQAPFDPPRPNEAANRLHIANDKVPSTRCLIVLYDATGMYLGSDVVVLPFIARECRRDHPGVVRALAEALVRSGVTAEENLETVRIEINPLWTPPYQR